MKRRVCETCHFYEAAGLANSGWCKHPQRNFNTGVRLVVRGNEIGCRNGWDDDLWVAADIDSSSTGEDDALSAKVPTIDDELTSIVAARYESDPLPVVNSGFPRDVVVRHAAFAEAPAPEKQARDLVTNPRAAIVRAREQFKGRQLREGRIADRNNEFFPAASNNNAGDADTGVDFEALAGEIDVTRPESAPFSVSGAESAGSQFRAAVPPVTRDEISRPYVTITDFPEDAPRFESVPEADSPARRGMVLAGRPGPEIRTEYQTHYVEDEYWLEDELIAENGLPPRQHRPKRESIFERFLRDRRERRLNSPAHLEFDSEKPDAFDDLSTDFEPADAAESLPAITPASPRQARPAPESETRPFADDDFSLPELPPSPARIESRRRSHPNTPHGSADSRPAAIPEAPRQVDLDSSADFGELPRWNGQPAATSLTRPVSVSHHVSMRPLDPAMPRICRTCRDFRPSESGDRGWCNNSWAFRHRRMVDADVLSCESSYGPWWLPNDSVWQSSADVSRHMQETPLLDRLLGLQERRVSSGR